ncbi:hypothetical protein MHF_1371 [Mycoplasma haemofelis Ohio2]|uniref:Uncharacterized protein n=1 Tax=Mycoplasma haemofelis (strain Ohio2) TaxID=859194 RepID=F6FGG9_MYCHI|nr:hypothetical protein MHF_1371 [Mycoplasma haemofelis Ohio2]
MNLGSKIAAGTGMAGTVAGGSYLLYPRSQDDSVKSKLIGEGYELMKGTDEAHWKKVYAVYKTKSGTDRFNGDGIQQDEGETSGISKLKKACEKSLSGSENSLYLLARRFCVVPKTLDQFLSLKNIGKLSTETTGTNADDSAWNAKETEFKKNLNTNNQSTSWNLSNESQKSAENVKTLKSKCKEMLTSETYQDGFYDKLEYFKNWCSK